MRSHAQTTMCTHPPPLQFHAVLFATFQNDLGMIPLEELGRVPGVDDALDRSTLGASASDLNGALDIEAEGVAGEDRDSLPVGDGSEPHHQVGGNSVGLFVLFCFSFG